VPDLANPVFAPIIAGVEAALAERRYAVLVAHAGADASALELVEGLVARRAEGLILATAHARDPVIARCVELGLPTVLVNRADPEGRLSAVTPDDREGMRLAVRRLVGLGHRHIGHIAGPQDVSTGSLRAEGFRSAMAEAGMAPGPVVEADAYTREAGEDAAERLLSRQRGLTAIAAANDLLALGALRALSARGLSCPDDVSVTGHNDMPLVDMVQPPLTTIRISHDLIGREGARLLLERIARPDMPPVQIRTPPELILRASTAPAGSIYGSAPQSGGIEARSQEAPLFLAAKKPGGNALLDSVPAKEAALFRGKRSQPVDCGDAEIGEIVRSSQTPVE